MILAVGTPVLAQQNDDDEDNRALLPNIESKNIEIRGEFVARFPGLERQPILGFDPSLRIYQFPADRMPYIETGAEAVADLTLSGFVRPAGSVYSPLQYAEAHNLFARIGVGSYLSPVVQLWTAIPLNDDSYIGLDLDYTASKEDYLENRPVTYRYFTGSIEYGVQLNEKMDLYIYAGVQDDFNYSAQFGTANKVSEAARINFEGVHAGITLTSYKNEVTGWRLEGEIRSFETTFDSDLFPGTVDEFVYRGTFSYRWALGHPGETIKVMAGARFGTVEATNLNPQQWQTFYAGAAYERLFNYQTRLYAEGRLYYISNFAESSIYPGVKISLSHWFGSRLKITGRIQAKPTMLTIEQLHQRNRFLGYENKLRHSYVIKVNGEASLEWYRGSKLYGGITYMNAEHYVYFKPDRKVFLGPLPTPDSPYVLNYYTLEYGDVTNMKIYAGISHQLVPETFWLNIKAYLQNPTLSRSDKPVPYSETWGLNMSVTYRPIERITLKAWGDYIADRTAALPNTELENIFLIGAQLDIRIIEGIGAYVKVINLLDQRYQYWQGYIERPLQIYGGITVTF